MSDLLAEPIMAWRVWRVYEPDNAVLDRPTLLALAEATDRGENPWRKLLLPYLGAVAATGFWTETTVRATCRAAVMSPFAALAAAPSHDAPHRDCQCGWWALHDEEQVAAALGRYLRDSLTFAYGRVQLWGHVVEHRDGYRAEYARPYDVTVIDGTATVVAGLRDRYAIDVQSGPLPERAAEIAQERSTLKGYAAALTSGTSGTPLTAPQSFTWSITGAPWTTMLLDPPKRRKRWWQW